MDKPETITLGPSGVAGGTVGSASDVRRVWVDRPLVPVLIPYYVFDAVVKPLQNTFGRSSNLRICSGHIDAASSHSL